MCVCRRRETGGEGEIWHVLKINSDFTETKKKKMRAKNRVHSEFIYSLNALMREDFFFPQTMERDEEMTGGEGAGSLHAGWSRLCVESTADRSRKIRCKTTPISV